MKMRSPSSGVVVAGLLLLLTTAALTPASAQVSFTNSPAPGTVGISYSFQFQATGATSFVYSCQCEGPIVPGLTLSASGLVSGTPTSAGIFTIFVQASDAGNPSNNSGFVMMSVLIGQQLLTINTTSVPDATRGVLYGAPLSASGGSGNYSWSISAGTLPAGISVVSTGSVAGTALASATVGPYDFTVRVTDGASSAFQHLTLTLRYPPISLSPATLPNGIVNGAYNSGVTASGGTGGPYTYTWIGTTPPGLNLNGTTGAITGIPTGSGTFNFTITASDTSPASKTQNYSITVVPVISVSPTSIPAGDALSNYSQTFTASGGSGTGYTFTIAGTPPGLGFNGATGLLSGPPSSSGSFNFTITAHDSAGFTGSQNYTLVVNSALTLAPATVPSGQVGTAYSQTFTASGGSGGYSYTFSGTTIPGLTFSGNTLAGNPTTGGSYQFMVTARDSLGSTVANQYTLSIAGSPILVRPVSIPTGQVGVNYSQTFTATGGNGGPYTWSISPGSLFGLTFTPATAMLAGNPTSFGTTTITVTASDGTLSGHTDYTLTIAPPALTLAPSSAPNGTVGTAYSQVFTASGGLGTYAFSIIGTQPPGLGLTPNGASVNLGGTPTTAGSYSFSIQVSDGSKTAAQSLTVAISNSAITLAPASPTLPPGIVNGSYSQTFVASGGNGGPYTYSITGATPGLTLNPSTGALSGAPTSATTYNFTIGATDGTLSATPKAYSITVYPLITVAPATIPSATLQASYSQTFTASGGSGTGYTFAISPTPAGMSFNTANGMLTGSPSSAGSSNFTITVHDSLGFAGSQNYTLVVNGALTLSPATLSAISTGTAYSQTFTASGGSGGYTYTFGGSAIPGLNFNAGVLSGTPTTGGTYPFSVTAKDSANNMVTVNYTLTINSPSITLSPGSLPAGTVNVNYSQTFVASGGNGGPYTYAISGSTPGLTLNTSTGLLSGAPTSATTYNFTITASDGVQTSAPKNYSIAVNAVVTIAPSTIPAADVQLSYSQTFTASGGTGTGYFYTISAPPPGLTINSATGNLSGVPTTSGVFNFTITAKDSGGSTGTSSTISLTVNPPVTLAPAPATLTSGQVGTGYSQAFTASGGSGGYTYTLVGTPPPGLGLNANVLSGTPTTGGTFQFSIMARDTLGGSATNAYSLTLANPPIVIQPTTISSGQVGVSYSQAFVANGGNGGPYTYSIGAPAPFGLGFNAANATLSGTPTSSGTANITISATDGQMTGQRTYSLTVAPAGLTLSPSTIGAGIVGVNYSQTFTVSGGSGNYTITLSPPSPAGLTFATNGATATLSGTPTVSGSFQITVQATDGVSSPVSRTYTLAISPSSLSISTTSLPGGASGTGYLGSLSATGGTPPYTWSISPGSTLPGGLMLTASGSITGTPNGAGTFPFGVTVTDSVGSTASTTLNIVVQPPALTFTTTSPLPPALSGVDYSVSLGASGGTPPYSFVLTGGPPGLSISGSTLSGKLTNAGSSAVTFNITVKVTDSAGASTSGGFQLTVQPMVPGLILSAGSLAFTAGSAGPPTTPEYISVSSTSQATPPFSVSSDQPWLSVNTGSGTAPATLQIIVNQNGLKPGTYTGTITVTGPDGSHTVTVTLKVNAQPTQLSVAPTIISFTSDGTSQPGPAGIEVSNAGDGTLTFTASLVNGSSWVSLGGSPSPTDVTGANPVTIPVNVRLNGRPTGDYRDVVHIDSNAGSADVPVTLLVAGGPTLTLSPAGSLYAAREGQGISNSTRSFQILTTEDTPINWTATLLGGSGWLTLNTPSGTTSAGRPGVVSYTVEPSKLAASDFYARIHVDAPTATNSPVDFLVVSSVAPETTPAVPDPSPAGLLFVSSPGSVLPPAQNVQINSSSATPLIYSAAANTYTGGNWLTVSPTNGNTSTGAPGQVRVAVNPAGLAPGVYRGGISFTLQTNPTGVRTVSVLLIVTSASQSPALISRALDGAAAGRAAVTPAAGCSPSKLVPLQTGLVSNFSTPAGWPTPLAIQLADDCGGVVPNASVVASFSNGDAPLSLQLSDSKNAVYSATWNPRGAANQVTVSARASAPNLQGATAQIVGTISPNKVPILFKHGTIHNMFPQAGAPLAPGTIVQIYGSGLAPGALQTSLPLPTNVSGTTVIIGGVEAPLYYVSDGQLNAELPLELTAGRQYQILVSANGALTTPDSINLEPVTPGVAALVDGVIIAQHVDSSYVTAASPAHPGEVVTIYLAGMGLTDVTVKTGQLSPSDPLARPMVQPTVTVNGEAAQIGFAGLTPQSVGLYQINFTVPADAPSGNLKLVVAQGDVQSNVSTIAVQPATPQP